MVKTTAKAELLKVLPPSSSDKWLAAHELQIIGYSENALCTRLSELAKEQRVTGRTRAGKHYKEWSVPCVMATIAGSDPT